MDSDIDWNCFTYNFTNDSYWRGQNYRFLTGSFITRRKLALYKIIDSDECPFCTEDTDDIQHAVLKCPLSRITWQNFQRVLNKLGINYEIDSKSVIYGVDRGCKNRNVINLMILKVKYKLASPKFEERILDQRHIESMFATQLKLELAVGKIRSRNKKKDYIELRWKGIKNFVLNNM